MDMKKYIAIAAAAAVTIALLPLTACKKTEERKRSHYSLTASYDGQSKTLSGVADFTYYNSTDNEISDLSFALWGNAYRQGARYSPVSEAQAQSAYYAGKSYGEQKVEKVENCAGWEICGDDENILNVTLDTPVYPDESANVRITYTLTLAEINHRTGVTQNTVNLGNFYPVLCAYAAEGFVQTPYYCVGDPFVSECADYDVTLTLPAGYIAATSGKQVSSSKAGDNVTTSYTLKNARDFAAVLSDKFHTSVREVNGCAVTIYYTGESEPAQCLNAAEQSLKQFSSDFGEYEYPTYSVVFTGLSVSGMEYPALSMISDKLDEATAQYTIAHETAHQWWYAMVGSDQVNCGWQDEGLAEYSALCFFERHPEYGFTRTQLLGSAIKSYRAYYSVYNQIFGKADTGMIRPLGEFAGDYEYINIAYNKGLLMFETLRTSMGDEKFYSALRHYFAANKGKIASYESLIASFAHYHDVEGLIQSYIEGKVVI